MSVLTTHPMPDPSGLRAEAGAALWWLGQAGFVVAQGGLRIVIDPYLSDSLAEKYRGKPHDHRRMMPPPVAPDKLTGIDWLLCTHGHTDHMDPGTIPPLLQASARSLGAAGHPRGARAGAARRGKARGRARCADRAARADRRRRNG